MPACKTSSRPPPASPLFGPGVSLGKNPFRRFCAPLVSHAYHVGNVHHSCQLLFDVDRRQFADLPAAGDSGRRSPLVGPVKLARRRRVHTGQTREEAIAMLRNLLGDRWQDSTLEKVEQAVSQAGQGTPSQS